MNLMDSVVMKNNYVLGPAMIPDKKIFRRPNNKIEEPHYVVFTSDTIEKWRTKFHADKFENNVNINHNGVRLKGIKMTKSFLISVYNRKDLPDNFKDLPNGHG